MKFLQGLFALVLILGIIAGALILTIGFWLAVGWVIGFTTDFLTGGFMSETLNSITGWDVTGGAYGLLAGAAMCCIRVATSRTPAGKDSL